MSAMISLVVSECMHGMPADGSVEDRLRHAMKAAYNHWMVTNENEQFHGALVAVIQTYDESDPERERIAAEARMLNRLRGMMVMNAAGGHASLADVFTEEDESREWIGLSRLWEETKNAAKAERGF